MKKIKDRIFKLFKEMNLVLITLSSQFPPKGKLNLCRVKGFLKILIAVLKMI